MDGLHYSGSDLAKLPHPFFVAENDADLFSETEEVERAWLMAPPIRVTTEKLSAALSEVETFAEWLENVEVEPRAS